MSLGNCHFSAIRRLEPVSLLLCGRKLRRHCYYRSQISKKTVTSAIARSNSTRYLLRYQDAIAPQFVIQSQEIVKGSIHLKKLEKTAKSPLF
ncbi:hypothetical protein QUB75_05750 [Microcoleus sp. K1-B6]|uniref:hypothetical protein n=1 Tax=unclassified Microcoleus TaxID=2642155 RepID=UPI002FCF8262